MERFINGIMIKENHRWDAQSIIATDLWMECTMDNSKGIMDGTLN